jgi:hypothetical protein
MKHKSKTYKYQIEITMDYHRWALHKINWYRCCDDSWIVVEEAKK